MPVWLQGLAWGSGLLACLAAMLDLVGNWDRELATIQFVLLVVGPVVWMIHRRSAKSGRPPASARGTNHSEAWTLAGLVFLASWLTCFFVGHRMQNLPPAYHDEYSYLFQAKTLLKGSFSTPSHPTHPELFDQMHVLNEGRMASRYYPGTGLWLAPFVLLKHPFWGHWLASALSAVFVFWTGYEIACLRVAVISGFVFAVSPGVALFGNLLLAHQPTLFGLCLFLWAFAKWQRTRGIQLAFVAGVGLALAMLCRPATAAGFGFPFGIAFLAWVLMGNFENAERNLAYRLRVLLAMAIPVMAGWAIMLAYNKDITGSWTTSTYQIYTDIYSPRHVYGFNNVVRGEQKLGPKVIEEYDRLAENLTPSLAAFTTMQRLVASFLWTFDALPQIICGIIGLGMLPWIDRRWRLIALAFLSLHAFHLPYWYVGIMGYHYVFETTPLLCLALGLGSDLLLRDWKANDQWLMPIWWWLLLGTSFAGDYLPLKMLGVAGSGPPRIVPGISTIEFPRERYAQFNEFLRAKVTVRPALVLIENEPDPHVDYIDNEPALKSDLLRGRFRPGKTDLDAVARDFPDRAIYYCNIQSRTIELKRLPGGTGND